MSEGHEGVSISAAALHDMERLTPSLRGMYRRGYEAALQGASEADNPYPDYRTSRGAVTFSRAFRRHWHDGWVRGHIEAVTGSMAALPASVERGGWSLREVLSERLVGLYAARHGYTMWHLCRTVGAHVCAGCGTRIETRSEAWRPLTNAQPRAERLCPACMAAIRGEAQ